MHPSPRHPEIAAALRAVVQISEGALTTDLQRVEAVSSCVRVMSENDAFAQRMNLTRRAGAVSMGALDARGWAGQFLGSFFNRSKYYEDGDVAFDHEYAEFERALYAESTYEEAVMVMCGITVTEPIEVAKDVFVRPLNINDRQVIDSDRGLNDRSRGALSLGAAAVAVRHQTPVFFGDSTKDHEAARKRLQDARLSKAAQDAADRIRFAVRPFPRDVFGFNRHTDWSFDISWSTWHIGIVDFVGFGPGPVPTISPADLGSVRRTFELLDPDRKALEIAARRFGQAIHQRRSEDAIVDFSIALEALLTNPMRADLAFRLSVYGALLAGETPEMRAEVYERLNRLYTVRSELVHGNQPKAMPELKDVEDLTHKIIIKAAQKLERVKDRPDEGKGKSGGPKTLKLDKFWIETLFGIPERNNRGK